MIARANNDKKGGKALIGFEEFRKIVTQFSSELVHEPKYPIYVPMSTLPRSSRTKKFATNKILDSLGSSEKAPNINHTTNFYPGP